MPKSDVISGRLGLAENLAEEQLVALIFETPFDVTGQGMAVIAVHGAESLDNVKKGESLTAAFDARSVLTFDEDITSRKKSIASLKVGEYWGEGVLEDGIRCNFVFSSNITHGKWRILYRNKRKGWMSKLFEGGEFVIMKIE